MNDISDVNEQDETFAINGTLELMWQDTRLAFDPVEIGAGYKLFQGPFQFLEVYQGWWPQLVAANGVGNIPLQDVSLKIHADASIKMVQEISTTLKSPMNLRKYPFDRQKLQLILEPLSFTASEVRWVYGPKMMDMPRHHLKIASWDLLGLNAESRIEQDQQGGS